jgi:hypothetical protein
VQIELERSLEFIVSGIPEGGLRDYCRDRMMVTLGLKEDVKRVAKQGTVWNHIQQFYDNFQRRV